MDRTFQALSDFSGEPSAFPLMGKNRDGDDIHARLDKLEDRERQIIELLGCEKPERIIHDLRNLLNELQLLKLLTEEMRQ